MQGKQGQGPLPLKSKANTATTPHYQGAQGAITLTSQSPQVMLAPERLAKLWLVAAGFVKAGPPQALISKAAKKHEFGANWTIAQVRKASLWRVL